MEQKQAFPTYDNKEYILSGTIDEIISVLVADFELSQEEARFVTYISTREKQDKIVFTEKDLNLWYMNEEIRNTAPIFNLPYTISITKVKLEIQHKLFVFLGTFVLTNKKSIVTLGLEFIWTLEQAIQKIDDDDYCIYGRIVDFLYTTQKGSFELNDIIPYDKEKVCNRKPEKWNCCYWNADMCSLTEAYILKRLNKLESRGILTRNKGYWQMVK